MARLPRPKQGDITNWEMKAIHKTLRQGRGIKSRRGAYERFLAGTGRGLLVHKPQLQARATDPGSREARRGGCHPPKGRVDIWARGTEDVLSKGASEAGLLTVRSLVRPLGT